MQIFFLFFWDSRSFWIGRQKKSQKSLSQKKFQKVDSSWSYQYVFHEWYALLWSDYRQGTIEVPLTYFATQGVWLFSRWWNSCFVWRWSWVFPGTRSLSTAGRRPWRISRGRPTGSFSWTSFRSGSSLVDTVIHSLSISVPGLPSCSLSSLFLPSSSTRKASSSATAPSGCTSTCSSR